MSDIRSMVTLPEGYVPVPLERLPGGADVTGDRRPRCRPDTHQDGKHSVLCLAGILGYRELEDGSFERYPPHPATIPGAVFRFDGPAYVRPCERGIVLGDVATGPYLDDLPEGYYDVRIEFVRKERSV